MKSLFQRGRERTIHTRNSHQSLDRRFPVIHSGREHGQHWNVIRLIILPRETVSGMGFIDCPLRRAKSLEPFLPDTTKDGAEILIEQKKDRPRRLTVSEAMQLQGYDPSRFVFPVSNTQAYRQIGNSVVVPAVSACATEISRILKREAR